MKMYSGKRFFAAGLFALMLVGTTAAESAEPQKFKFSDLFKKTKASSGKSSSTNKEAESKPATEADKTEEAGKKESSTKTPAKEVSPDTSSKTKASAVSSLKEMADSDQLKSLTGQLDKVGSDPDALLRSARERFRKLKEKESSSKKEPVAVARSAEDGKKTAPVKAMPKAGDKELVKSKAAPVSATPVKATQKVVTAGVVTNTPKTSRVVDSSRPPSLASVTAVAAAPITTSREIPPENLQTSLAASDVPAPKPLVAKKLKKKSKSAPGVMEITSDEVEMDNEKHTTTFIGNVNLAHPTFHLKSDRLVIHMHEEGVESEAPFKMAVATGARVIVERLNDKGGKDVGQSRKVVYDALTGDLVLSEGPPQLQSGASLVKTNSQSATITLKKDGNHSVKDKGTKGVGGAKIVIPVGGGKGGKGGKAPTLIPTKLGDISKRK